MGNYSKKGNLAPGGRSVPINSLTGRLKNNKNNYKYIGIGILVLILFVLVIADKKGKINLGIFPKDKKQN